MLTPYQTLLYQSEEAYPFTSLHTITGIAVIKGEMDTICWQKALKLLLQRYPNLQNTLVHGESGVFLQPAAEESAFFQAVTRTLTPLESIQDIAQRPLLVSAKVLFSNYLFKVEEKKFLWLLKIHHLLADGWAVARIFQEMGRLYSVVSADTDYGNADTDYNKPINYWEKYFQSIDYQQDKSFWQAKIFNDLTPSRPQPYNCQRLTTTLSAHRLKKLKEFCAKERISLYAFLLAVWAIYEFRTTQKDEIRVGIPLLNRKNREERKEINLKVNFLPLQILLNPQQTIREVCKKIQAELSAMYRHQAYPLTHLYQDLQERGQSGKLFDTLISYEKHDYGKKFAHFPAELTYLPPSEDDNKLTIHLMEYAENEGLTIATDYATTLYTAKAIREKLNHWQYLALQMISDSTQNITQINLLPKVEQRTLQRLNERTKLTVGEENCLTWFEKKLRQAKDNVAVIAENEILTYHQLAQQAQKVCNFLRQDTAKNQVVALAFRRNAAIIPALLGAMYAQWTFIILDIQAPQARNQAVLKQTKASWLLSDLDDWRIDFEQKMAWNDILRMSFPSPIIPKLSLKQPVYQVFTSGTTGLSKVVTVHHDNLRHITCAWQAVYDLQHPRILQWANFSFDVFIGDVCRSIFSGGTLFILTAEERLNPEKVCQIIDKQKITHFETTPVFAEYLAPLLSEKARSLQCLIVGSDKFSGKLYNQLQAILPDSCRLVNSYGLTECTIDSAYFECKSLQFADTELIPIGNPFPFQQIWILDRFNQPCPIGEEGQIWIGGEGLTADIALLSSRRESFQVECALSPFGGWGAGDYGYWTIEAGIVLTHRQDTQLKIKGFRIELREIEQVSLALSGIKQAVAFDFVQNEQIYLALAVVGSESEKDLQIHLQNCLPVYSLPNVILCLDSFPLTVNGKVAIAEIKQKIRLEAKTEVIAPKTKAEEVLVNVFEKIFAQRPLGLNHHFFVLGGDSIRAMQIIAQVRQQGYSLRMAQIFQHPRLEDLALQMQTIQVESLQISQNQSFLEEDDLVDIQRALARNLGS
jgi:non-ribosomal peptide synthetase component F/aryl carrier-like protein